MKKMNQFMMGMLAIAATAFTSCSTDDTTSPMSDRESVENFYMKLQITGNTGNGTRTTGEPTEVGTTEESTINSGTIWLVAPDGSVAFSKQLTGLEWDGTKTSKPIKVAVTQVDEKTPYSVYFLANKTDNEVKLKDSPTGQTFTSQNGGLDYATDNAFVMFNQNDKSVKANQYTVTFTAANKEETNPATPTNGAIKLDRVTARLEVPTSVTTINEAEKKNDKTVNIDDIKSVSYVGFAPFNVATKENMEQKWNDNWAIITLPHNLGELYCPKANYGNGRDITTTQPTNWVAKDSKTYIFENATDDINNATGVFLKYTATAETTANKDFEDGTFYRYDKHVFTSIKDIMTFAGASNPFGNLTADEVVKSIAAPADATKVTSDPAVLSAFRTKYEIEVFERGEVYYSYYIQDEHSTGKTYSVLRNSIYRMDVKNIYDLGTDTPNTPDVKPNYYLNVEVTVNPWVLNTISVDLE